MTLRKIAIWLSKNCQKPEFFSRKLTKIVIFFNKIVNGNFPEGQIPIYPQAARPPWSTFTCGLTWSDWRCWADRTTGCPLQTTSHFLVWLTGMAPCWTPRQSRKPCLTMTHMKLSCVVGMLESRTLTLDSTEMLTPLPCHLLFRVSMYRWVVRHVFGEFRTMLCR